MTKHAPRAAVGAVARVDRVRRRREEPAYEARHRAAPPPPAHDRAAAAARAGARGRSAAPLTEAERVDRYRRQNGTDRLTGRQARQIRRMNRRHPALALEAGDHGGRH